MQQCKLRARAKGAHLHQPKGWPVPHTCAQLFRPYWGSSVQCTTVHVAVGPMNGGNPCLKDPLLLWQMQGTTFVSCSFFFLLHSNIHYYCYIDSRFLSAPGTITHGSIRLKPRSLASSQGY